MIPMRLACMAAASATVFWSAARAEAPPPRPAGVPAAVAGKERPDRAVAILGGYVEDGAFRPLAPPPYDSPSLTFESIFQRIPRYTNSVVISLTEYNPQNCAPIDPGKWSIVHLEKFGTATPGSFTGHPTSGPCTSSTYTFAAVYFIWNKHTNETQRADTRGPIDTFYGEWKTTDGIYDILYSIDVNVPVVRPKGEISAFEGWNGGKGRWRVTLAPPDTDKSFDFTGETIRETFSGRSDSCPVDSPNFPAPPIKVKNGPPGNFGDQIGYDACVIEYSRAVKRTPCGYRIKQKMEISAPSDGGAFTQYSVNSVGSTIHGRILDQNEGQHGIGDVTSFRFTPLGEAAAATGVATSRIDCLRSLLGVQLLPHF